jgi:hypothetical protein
MSEQQSGYTYRPPAEREDALREAVRGLLLVETITAMFERVRRAGFTDCMDLENAYHRRGVKEANRGR